ncbi:hypothetical protein AVEN_113338-1 [Araneus ventricosus]|uniref:Endonuclease/exonuclease/phosphatase domain-containing protein n=1 Tax=Araneus ventricosus TaxID=182803 RepID=A0A4Y2KLJ1_ARAVE|nr:hypothetical protein AVEN_113338-1 [Araneus ventricosus]
MYRTDLRNKNGGGLAFLIRGIHYQSIDINTRIINNTNLEIQGVTVVWRGRPLNIFNMYHPPDLKSLSNEILDLFVESSICIGDLNAKHPTWGSTNTNPRGIELLNMIDDKGFITLNDGTHTHYSHIYNSKEALDIAFVSPDLGPSCTWKVQENIRSDHLPILIELKKRQSVCVNN